MSCIKNFLYSFNNDNKDITIKYPIEIPLPDLVKIDELVHIFSKDNNIPLYLFDDIKLKLEDFVYVETNNFCDEIGDFLINLDVDNVAVANYWANLYKTSIQNYRDMEAPCDQIIFSKIFASLVNSPHVDQLIDIQMAFSEQVLNVIKLREEHLNVLQIRQQKEIEMAMKDLGTLYEETDINDMAKRHLETIQMAESKFASELSSLGESQRRDYKELCISLHEQLTSNQSKLSSENYNKFQKTILISSPSRLDSDKIEEVSLKVNEQSKFISQTKDPIPLIKESYNQKDLSSKNSNQAATMIPKNEYVNISELNSLREDSFTVHIGTQLKTTQNLKLVSCDILDFCDHPAYYNQNDGRALRLQTMLTLYSFSLKGVVLMVDNRLNTFRGIKKRFADICEKSTELHFKSLNEQLEEIQQKYFCHDTFNENKDLKELPKIIKSEYVDMTGPDLRLGDMYITRHSNLTQVHTVFHVVSEDAQLITDISSRHPIIPALKNVIWICFSKDIHDIAIPLLLVHEYVKEMNLNWCLRRAELILKCVKGFVVEMAMRSAEKESIIIQFIVPKNLPDNIFDALREMIPTIFKMSNPVSA